MPSKLSKKEIVAFLKFVAYERICCSCWAEILAEYLDESLGLIWLNLHVESNIYFFDALSPALVSHLIPSEAICSPASCSEP